MRQNMFNGYVWILLAALLWSLLGVVSKFCQHAGRIAARNGLLAGGHRLRLFPGRMPL